MFRKNITAQEMWDNDKEKIRVAKLNGIRSIGGKIKKV